jgi:hypothetical protein
MLITRLLNTGLVVPLALFSTLLLGGCRDAPPPAYSSLIDLPSIPVISQDVRRVAVLYPPTQERDLAFGYAKLEQAVLHIARQRPWVRVLDRRHLLAVTIEQRMQLSVRFSDDGAVHLGRLLGADSIIVFHIDGPSWRDRLLARMYGTMPPVAITSKVVQVETGELLYHDMVIRTPVPASHGWDTYASDFELQPLLRASLELGLAEAIDNLRQAFR